MSFDEALGEFCKEAERKLQFLRDVALERQPRRDIIYHYTDHSGLRGIVENGNLRFTSIFNLNDPSEIQHGFQELNRAVRHKFGSNKDDKDGEKFTLGFRSFFRDGGIQQAADIFVCCFSREGDDLGQWRAYAADARGFALGFDSKLMCDAFAADARKLPDCVGEYLEFPVTYDDPKRECNDPIQPRIRSLQDELAQLAKIPFSASTDDDQKRRVGAYLSQFGIELAMAFKHRAYENEHEHRFLQVHKVTGSAPNVLICERGKWLARYREMPWRLAPNTLREVRIGPPADRDRAEQFVRDCLKVHHHLEAINVEISEIPYRSHAIE